MKLIRFEYDGSAHNGTLEDGKVVFDSPGNDSLSLALDDVKLLAPAEPSKIVLVGLNYATHAKELNMETPQEPVIFLKPATALIGPGERIKYPKSSSRVDYEGELAIVIKDKVRGVSEKDALKHVLGYSCFNDVTARDLQEKDGQWTRSKSFDTFAPLGPWIETDLDPNDIGLKTFLNGEMVQSSRTSDFIFKVPRVIEFISSVMTLLPGDIIATGTPPGVGPVGAGDEVSVEIEGIGTLTNTVE